MMDNELLLTAGIGGGIFLLLVLGYYGIVTLLEMRKNSERISEVRKRWSKDLSTGEMESLRRHIPANHDKISQKVVHRLISGQHLERRLERTGHTISLTRYLVLNLGLMALMAGLILATTEQSALIALLIGIVFGFGAPHVIVGRMIRKRTHEFLLLLPDAIDLIVRGLRSGLPIQEGFKIVTEEIRDPVGIEFGNISHKVKLGVPLEKALHEKSQELGIIEFDFMVISIILQRETGGNLSEILDNLSEAIRGRHMLKMKIKALSSEARASAMILLALPFFVIGALSFLNPDYLTPMVEDPRGKMASLIVVGMMGFGMWVMNRLAKFDI